MPKIISRKMAIARGLTRYFTREPCTRGHVCERFVCDGRCVECNRLNQRSPTIRAARRRYSQTPKGRAARWRADHYPKGAERRRRYDQSPKGRDRHFRYFSSDRNRERQRGYQSTAKRLAWRRGRDREHFLKKIEAAYKANPTQVNYTRLMNLIARRHRDGR
jgi:hypothetical protein